MLRKVSKKDREGGVTHWWTPWEDSKVHQGEAIINKTFDAKNALENLSALRAKAKPVCEIDTSSVRQAIEKLNEELKRMIESHRNPSK